MLSSMALILKELCPTTGSRPMSVLEANGFVLCAYDVPTGLKMVMLAEPGTQGAHLSYFHAQLADARAGARAHASHDLNSHAGKAAL